MRIWSSILVLLALASCGEESGAPAEPAIVTPPPDPETIPPVIPPGAERMTIHGSLKLPWLTQTPGDHLVWDVESMKALLLANVSSVEAGRIERENHLDFGSRMAIIVARTHPTGGRFHEIEAVWKTPTELLVVIRAERPAKGAFVAPLPSYPHASAVVDRSDLPLRTVQYFN